MLRISLLFPNVWINPFGGRWQTGMIAFVPIEPGRTRLYVRTYQRCLPMPQRSTHDLVGARIERAVTLYPRDEQASNSG